MLRNSDCYPCHALGPILSILDITRAFVDSVKYGYPMTTDIYDAAVLMCITVLSEQSIAAGGAPVAVPDFTRGAYLTRKPLTERDNPWSF